MTKNSNKYADLLAEEEISNRLKAMTRLITRLKSQPILGQKNWTRDELYPADPNAKPACSRSGWK
jgi:hypothetical protein